jgi:hypothetical protein
MTISKCGILLPFSPRPERREKAAGNGTKPPVFKHFRRRLRTIPPPPRAPRKTECANPAEIICNYRLVAIRPVD